jgi:Zn-dependent peptidase ImmA (M78 family)
MDLGAVMDKKQILKLALECRLDDGSIDIVQLASKTGIAVYGCEKPESYSAEIIHIPHGDKFEILVNTNLSLHQQRFSIAHELAHFILHKEEIKTYGSLKKAADHSDPKYFPNIEKEADEFGEELLMPEGLIRDDFPDVFDTQKVISFQTIHEIAARFKVSALISASRLGKFRTDIPYISNSYS